mmetsp:Transcript_1343/g.3869  ORF Transcript_1343/g.3869 Transcript_1343/m.3869 type:complete len:257 (-) Transcript_1343:52-822(-)
MEEAESARRSGCSTGRGSTMDTLALLHSDDLRLDDRSADGTDGAVTLDVRAWPPASSLSVSPPSHPLRGSVKTSPARRLNTSSATEEASSAAFSRSLARSDGPGPSLLGTFVVSDSDPDPDPDPDADADPSLLLPPAPPPAAEDCAGRADFPPRPWMAASPLLLRPPPPPPSARLRSGEMAPGPSSSSLRWPPPPPSSNGLGLPAVVAVAVATAFAAAFAFLLAGRSRVGRPREASDRTRMAAAHSSRSPREEATR